MMKIAILIGYMPNPRILRRTRLESTCGEVHMVCWDRGSNMTKPPEEDGFSFHRIRCAAESNPLKRLLPYYKFTKSANEILDEIDPDIIHVQGLDMLRIACKRKHQSKKSVHINYEVADLHRLLVDKQKGFVRKAAQWYLKREDQRCCKEIDLLIVTSEMFVERYFDRLVPPQKTMYFPNVPDSTVFQHFQKKKEPHAFTVGFIGDVRYKTQMKNLLQAAQRCNMPVLFAGIEKDGNEIEQLCRFYKNATWYGRYDYASEIADLYERCDVVFSVYDADMENVRVALPNKLYEAIYCELPIIVARGTYLSELVTKWGVGVSVKHDDVDELADALIRLRDDKDYYQHLCQRCHENKEIVNLERYNEMLLNRIKAMQSGIGQNL